MTPRPLNPFIAHFGSLRSTLVLLGALAAVVLARPAWWPLSLAFGALALNLLCALWQHPLLRRQRPLLVFHLALLALLALVGWGRLASLDGRFELTQGQAFDGQLIDQARGPFYSERLQRLAFRNDGFEIDYAPGRKRGATRNQVTWQDAGGRVQNAVIGDHHPLVLDGHRIYTSPNKGFAPVLAWLPAQGEPVQGAVHLPSYPMHELRQSREWALPDGRPVWVQLQFDDTLIDPQQDARFRLPEQHRLVVRVGGQRAVLAAGEALQLPGGTLRYTGLRSWMGYRVAHDPTLPWLLATALLATAALVWHYLRKFVPAARPLPARKRGWQHG